ncbi:protein of unknown function [Dyadobacter soli]|uniref:DUF4932 domain-containing protein n=1 Tax=Dyadobacter soli TaxID=659014 RepID=A0A1G7KU28_9BACT|nr:DUF4932 domain-containing protein [Dyadobacter soli]SDF40239.1 protein of unknown function [Dyadobacter soli]
MKTFLYRFAKQAFISLVWLYAGAPSHAQHSRVVLADSAHADIREGDVLVTGNWNISPQIRPDVYDAFIEGKSKRFAFITNRDSVVFEVEPGKSYPFVVLLNGKDSAFTEFKGIKIVPRARFSKAYQAAHRGKTLVEIPEVYELINIVFALTDRGRNVSGFVNRDTDYYREVMAWFEPYTSHEVVEKVNKGLGVDGGIHAMKMDAYPFDLAADGKITQGPVYDRIGNSYTNNLLYYLPDLENFAKASRFQEFYNAHSPYYNHLIQVYRDSVGVPEMQRWLGRNFPSTHYDAFKIIFSPLVSANQSASFFDIDGFCEAQAHVNFPFHKPGATSEWSEKARFVMDGNIVFTEFNHSFIGPEGQKTAYRDRIQKVFKDLSIWNDNSKPARYYDTPQTSFDEYMNWALVSLRYVDHAPFAEQEKLIASNEDNMVNFRGFRRFKEFDQFLVKIYKERKKGQTVADLYPQIVTWFEKNNR